MTYPTNEQLAWLAGLWDGEGTITVFEVREANKKPKYTPSVSVVNTNMAIMSEAAKILDGMGTKFHFHEQNRGKTPVFVLQTRKMADIETFLNAVTHYLIGKKPQAELTLRYVEGRLSQVARSWGGYSSEEDGIVWEVNALNRRWKSPGSSTTKREAPTGEDIVSSNIESVS